MTFKLIKGLLPANSLFVMEQWMRDEHRLRDKGKQTGFALSETPEVFDRLKPLLGVAEQELKGSCVFAISSSSCRMQTANGHAALGPHQDTVALLRREGLTFWVPLCEIDEFTPTLAVGEEEPEGPHHSDKHGYAVLSDSKERTFKVICPTELGDVALFSPLVVHRTFVPTDAKRDRISLDVRVLKR